jgi:single-strand DNA-binding protein
VRPTVTLSGNLATDVSLRSTSGGAVAGFRIAVNDDWFDKKSGQWRSRTVYLQVSAWRQLGEHVAACLVKGNPVVVVGRLVQRQYEDKDGQTRTVVDLEADTVALDLGRGTARYQASPRGPQTSDLAPAADAPEQGTVVIEHSGVAA